MNSKKGRGRGRGRNLQVPPGQVNEPIPGINLASESPPPYCQNQETPSRGRGRGNRKIMDSLTQDYKQLNINVEEDNELSSSASSPDSLRQSPDMALCTKSELKLASRPNYGTRGRPIKLICNYFQLKSSGTVFHYDIEIISLDQVRKYGKHFKDKKLLTAAEAAGAGYSKLEHELSRSVSKFKCKEVFDKLVASNGLSHYNPVFDGVKNVFTSKPLPFQGKQTVQVSLEVERKVRKYEVQIQPVRKNDGTNQIHLNQLKNASEGECEILMALNSILNHRNVKSSQIQIGRSFFYLNQPNKINLGEGLEIWFGYNQSVRSTERGSVIVLNLAAKAFHREGPVIEYINDVLGRDIRSGQALKAWEIKNVSDALKGVRVEVTHLPYPRRYCVEGISRLPASGMEVNMDNKMISIAEYFRVKYKPLRYSFLPCLYMRSSNKQTYIPFEHCKVMKGQPKLGKLNPATGAKMIKQTAIPPDNRFQSIMKSSKDVMSESGQQMQNYNLLMNVNLLPVKGRVLNPPALAYREQSSSVPDHRGVWNMNGNKFFKAMIEVDSWILLDFAECPEAKIERFINFFVAAGRKVGLNLNNLISRRRCGRNVSSEEALRAADNSKAGFAIIILSRRDRFHNYDEIKFIADHKLQFVNQCVDEKVLNRFDDQIATNLCLKINAKLGGVNHILSQKLKVLSTPVMIVGADAVHSVRGSRCPSIAAVVGSMDAYPSKYKICVRIQENPDGKMSQELILEMREMFKNLLNAFYHNTRGKRPEKIIFFRDGVSEGQFQKAYEYEVGEIQKACQEETGSLIPITFLVVQKRHQTRFKTENPNEGTGRHRNIPPGTTVDTDVTHPNRFDYFLNSHEGIQGTNKPAHYTILHDDNKFSADEVQELSYHLCYTYNKCNRSISIPAPVKYADLACYRAKKYADFHLLKEQERSSSSSSSSVNLPDHARQAINSMGEKGNNFFYV